MVMLDIERELVSYLTVESDCPAYADVPNPRPERFITVERTGGRADLEGAIDYPTVAVQSWAPTRLEASQLAYQVNDLLMRLPDESLKVMSCTLNSLYNFPDPDSRGARYQAVYEFVTC